MNLEDVESLYDAGLLTRGELYEMILDLEDAPAAEVHQRFGHDPKLIPGLEAWVSDVLSGATAFGGEWTGEANHQRSLASARRLSSELQAHRDVAAPAPPNPDPG